MAVLEELRYRLRLLVGQLQARDMELADVRRRLQHATAETRQLGEQLELTQDQVQDLEVRVLDLTDSNSQYARQVQTYAVHQARASAEACQARADLVQAVRVHHRDMEAILTEDAVLRKRVDTLQALPPQRVMCPICSDDALLYVALPCEHVLCQQCCGSLAGGCPFCRESFAVESIARFRRWW
jgi:hypothetical protein